MLALWQDAAAGIPRRRPLADRLHLDPGTLSPLVKRLEATGYLTRSRNEQDGRVVDVALTPAAAACATRPSASRPPSRRPQA
ncbi:MarR family transcriptional regulator [Oerskovia sp. M15]